MTDATAVIAQLQQRVQGQIDGDQLLPADGSTLLALLVRALAALTAGNAAAARAEIAAFIGQVQALMEAGVLEAADGRPLIEAAAAMGAFLPSAGGS